MARDHARVHLSIWGDDGFRGLTPRAQHLYFTLLTHPQLSYCGVTDWRPRRLRALATGWQEDGFHSAAIELAVKLFIVVDEDTEEVLVRSFIRHDGLMNQPRMAVSVVRAYDAVASQPIRKVVVHELQRLYADQPELKGWGKDVARGLLERPAVDPEDFPTGFGDPQFAPNRSSDEVQFGPNQTSPTPAPAPSPTPNSNLPTPPPATSPTPHDPPAQNVPYLPAVRPRGGREVADLLNQTAALAIDHDIVDGYERDHGRFEAKDRTRVLRAVAEHRKNGFTTEEIHEGISLWEQSDSFSPTQIGSFIRKARAASKPRGEGKPTTKARGYMNAADQLLAEVNTND